MKKIIIALILFSTFLFAQEGNENQNIELPEFVITGVRKISIPAAKKKLPGLITPLSKKFFLPTYTQNDFNPASFTKIYSGNLKLINYKVENYGLIRGRIGSVTLPEGEFYFGKTLGGILLNSQITGKKEREFVTGGGYNYLKLTLGAKYFIDHNSSFLPGLGIAVDGNYKTDSYKLYGSGNPSFLRKTNTGNFSVSLFNYFTNINYGLKFNDNYLKLKENNLTENSLSFSAFTNIPVYPFTFEAKFNLINQNLNKNNSNKFNKNYIDLNAGVKTQITKNAIVAGGIFYSSGAENNFLSVKASLLMKLTKNISLFALFNPHSKFLTIGNFLKQNRFYELQNTDNMFVKYKNNIKAELKYGYYEYFEIGIGAGYSRIDNLPYFVRKVNSGNLALFGADGVDNYFVNVDLLFHKTLGGKFYGFLKYQNLTNGEGKRVPYYPEFDITLNYLYSFTSKIDLKMKLKYLTGLYTDEENKNRLPDYINISAYLGYKLANNLKATLSLENLINRKNYFYEGYRSKTFDLSFGIEYRW